MKIEEMEVEFDVTCDISYQIMEEDIQNYFLYVYPSTTATNGF